MTIGAAPRLTCLSLYTSQSELNAKRRDAMHRRVCRYATKSDTDEQPWKTGEHDMKNAKSKTMTITFDDALLMINLLRRREDEIADRICADRKNPDPSERDRLNKFYQRYKTLRLKLHVQRRKSAE